MRNTAALFLSSILLQAALLKAQTPTKEAMNGFALYTKTQNVQDLIKAKQAIDQGYLTKKDTLSYKNNLIRGLIYSTLAYADSTRKIVADKNPLEEALFSFDKLRNKRLNYEHEPEINYIKKQLAAAFLIKANSGLKEYNYEDAYDSYRWVDSLNSGKNPLVKLNLAVLSQRLGYRSRAIGYYEQLIENKETALPSYYLTLAAFYESEGDIKKALEVLQGGRRIFPGSEDLLFKVINIYADSGEYAEVIKLAKEALQLQPNNINLNYLTGFAYDFTGKPELAEEFYKKIISLEPNNYDSNYSLGLLYLKKYFKEDNNKEEISVKANSFLNKALEIDPNAVNSLKALAVLYEQTGDMVRLERINNKLNQIILK